MVLLFSRPSRFPSCSSTFAVRLGFPVVAQRRSLHGPDLFWTKVFPVMPDMVVDVLVAQVVQFILSLRRGLFF